MGSCGCSCAASAQRLATSAWGGSSRVTVDVNRDDEARGRGEHVLEEVLHPPLVGFLGNSQGQLAGFPFRRIALEKTDPRCAQKPPSPNCPSCAKEKMQHKMHSAA